jgi:hypothetical protein
MFRVGDIVIGEHDGERYEVLALVDNGRTLNLRRQGADGVTFEQPAIHYSLYDRPRTNEVRVREGVRFHTTTAVGNPFEVNVAFGDPFSEYGEPAQPMNKLLITAFGREFILNVKTALAEGNIQYKGRLEQGHRDDIIDYMVSEKDYKKAKKALEVYYAKIDKK